jgi:AcrR family transcriptional regulator
MNIHSSASNRRGGFILAVMLATPSPRGSCDFRGQREAEILDSIRQTFADKGFDGASMQDLARAAGMSVGNFYRYFPSKAAMVQAIVRRELAELERNFAMVLGAPDPFATLRAGLHQRIEEDSRGCAEGTLWCEISAAAARKPEIEEIVLDMEREITRYFMQAFQRITGLSAEEAERRFEAHAILAVTLVKAVAMRGGHGFKPDSNELLALVKRIVDVLLNEVASARSFG